MLCISELRGLQDFQTKHPETVLVAMSITDERAAIDKLVDKQKLSTLRISIDTDCQDKFGLSEAIPATVIVDGGLIRVLHEGVMADPVATLEADLAAIRAATKAAATR